MGKEVSGNKYPADYSEQISETVGFNYRRKERMGIVLVDDKNGLDYTDLCVADIDSKLCF